MILHLQVLKLFFCFSLKFPLTLNSGIQGVVWSASHSATYWIHKSLVSFFGSQSTCASVHLASKCFEKQRHKPPSEHIFTAQMNKSNTITTNAGLFVDASPEACEIKQIKIPPYFFFFFYSVKSPSQLGAIYDRVHHKNQWHHRSRLVTAGDLTAARLVYRSFVFHTAKNRNTHFNSHDSQGPKSVDLHFSSCAFTISSLIFLYCIL